MTAFDVSGILIDNVFNKPSMRAKELSGRMQNTSLRAQGSQFLGLTGNEPLSEIISITDGLTGESKMEEPDEFAEFLRQLIRANALEDPARGVAEQVVTHNSLNGLSEPQHAALMVGVKKWIRSHFPEYNPGFIPLGQKPPKPECTARRDEVPWCEVYVAATLNGGVCSYCVQVLQKND